MLTSEIESNVNALQSSSVQGEEDAWQKLKPLGVDVVPYLFAAYPKFKKWEGRVSLVYHSIRYARVSEEAFKLGVLALHDRATLVRYRACSLLAYSLRKDALPYLRNLLTHNDARTVEDAIAAIDAIQSGNHHYFVDRKHSGNVTWTVNESDNAPR